MKFLLATVMLAIMTTPVFSASYLGDFSGDPDICISQTESISTILDGDIVGAKLEFQSPNTLIFSAPSKVDYFQLDFNDQGCAAAAYSINEDEYKLIVNPS